MKCRMWLHYMVFACCGVFALVSCGTDSEESDRSTNIEGITDHYAADESVKDVAESIYNDLLDSLSAGSFTEEEVYGTTGSAIVTGRKNYHNSVSCGSSCVRSSRDISITAEVNNYKGPIADNKEVTLSGTVAYTDTTWSQQSGLSYSSGGSISVSGTDVAFASEAWDDWDLEDRWGYQDTIGFSGSGSGIHAPFSGWCIASNGETYSF